MFADKPDDNGTFQLIREDRGAAPTMVLPPGSYIVHVGFGLATAVKPVTPASGATVRESSIFRSAGCVSKAVSATPSRRARSHSVFKGSQFEGGDRPRRSLPVPGRRCGHGAGGHLSLVSNYGDGNSVVRSDSACRPAS